jgi:hypothetical protein
MELDGYNQDLGVAFEYQGFQHYQKCYLHSTEEEFEWQQQKDREKRDLCRKHNVKLIEVPWHTNNLQEFAKSVRGSLS